MLCRRLPALGTFTAPTWLLLLAAVWLPAGLAHAQPAIDTLFGIDNGDELVTIDPATGLATAAVTLSGPVVGLTYDPVTETLFGTSGGLVVVDPQTGEVTVIGDPFGVSIQDLAAHPVTGELFAVSSFVDVLYRINPATGDLTEVGPLGGGEAFTNVTGLAFDPTGQTLFGVENGNDQLVTLDTDTGAATGVGNPFTVGGIVVTALAFDPETGDLFGSDIFADQLVAIDPATGIGTPIGPTGFDQIESLAFAPAIPEPAGVALIGLGVLAMANRRRHH